MNRRTVLTAVLGAGFAATAAGCGQKGPLYLPAEKLEEIERKRDEKAPDKSSRNSGDSRASG